MRIRTQLLVAFLLLSVVPLTAIVLYSYSGSARALRRASEEEGARLTRDMNSRLASVREELGAAVARTGVPVRSKNEIITFVALRVT